MSKKVYYKVLSPKRFSAVNHDHKIKYPLKKWAIPRIPHSKLMVFKSRAGAESFIDMTFDPYNIPRHIHKCHIKGGKFKNIKISSAFHTMTLLKKFWKDYNSVDGNPAPQDTVLADAVYCLE